MSYKTLLLVEDEIIISLSQAKVLEKFGYQVITADSGLDAIDKMNSHPEIQLVLMDIDLGKGMDGTVAAERILQLRHLPIVFLSSHIEPEIVSKAEKIISYGFVSKNTSSVVLDASITIAFKLFEAHQNFQLITERKFTEMENLQSIINIENLLNSNTDLMWSLKPDYTLIIANTTLLEGFHKTTGTFLKSGDSLLMKELFPEEYLSYWKGFYDKALNGEEVETEIEIPTEDPLVKQLYQVSFKPIFADNKILGACCYGRNITERRISEQKINSLLHEKELILKEVHHRIKNNMTLMSALLTLQANADINDPVKEALLDASRRIQSMTILYDKLYKSQDFNRVSFELYLKQLVSELVDNFFNQKHVEIEMSIQDFSLDAKNLQTLGIIINELITNIMKYAFLGIERGRIEISAVKEEKEVTLLIKDNGIGIPELEIKGKGKGFGLLLVRELSSQLKGKLTFYVNQGTSIQLQFPL